jgi:uncharacterized metal-binding protein
MEVPTIAPIPGNPFANRFVCYSLSMAMGKTHDWVTLACLPSVWLVCRMGFHLSWHLCTLVTLGTYIGGFWLSPDLDTRSRPFYRWGIFRFIWWPYQWVAKHRSGLSHGILLASWLRLLYLSAILIVIYSGTYLYIARLANIKAQAPNRDILLFLNNHLHDILWLGLGIWIGSLIHIVLDHLSSAIPKKRGRR